MGVHARAQEILACTSYFDAAVAGYACRTDPGFGHRPIHLHAFLTEDAFQNRQRGLGAMLPKWQATNGSGVQSPLRYLM